MPYSTFLDLVTECKKSSHLKRWGGSNTVHYHNGPTIIPMELLVLGTIRCLGRGWTMDVMQENTAISEETIRVSITKFMPVTRFTTALEWLIYG